MIARKYAPAAKKVANAAEMFSCPYIDQMLCCYSKFFFSAANLF